MPAIKGITVSVGYAELLRVTLVRNMRHMTSCLVVTSPDDEATREVAAAVPGVRVFETDAFTRPDANGVIPYFNKGLAMTEGLNALGLEGWVMIWDADILLPPYVPFERLKVGKLYGMRRRVLEDPSAWTPELDWRTCPLRRDGGPVGFAQIFHADDPAVRGKSPLYDVSFAHAGGGDAAFMAHWPRNNHSILPCEVLHLGPPDTNWMGRSPEAVDKMAKFVTENGWTRAAAKFTPEQVARAGEIVHRVQVPGYPASDFELPFVRKAQAARGEVSR